jgi:phosphoribosylformimino-5-aminoimidazole carboxamide ribotide isomerase
MWILPVLDLKGGSVVRGVAGRRAEYRPIVSMLIPSADPIEIAQALGRHFGLASFYLADLDAIAGEPPAWGIYRKLHELGFSLWVDAGVKDVELAVKLAGAGIDGVVVGLETVRGPDVVEELACGPIGKRIVFSLDLKDGVPLGDRDAWGWREPLEVARMVLRAGVEKMIVLDLARVGMGAGLGTEDLCETLAAQWPAVEIIAGGGVRNAADLEELQRRGIKGAMMASALHDGRITPADLHRLGETSIS